MGTLHGLTDFEADNISKNVLDKLTANGVLEPKVTERGIAKVQLDVSAEIAEGKGPNIVWFDVSTKWTNVRTGVCVTVRGRHRVTDGIPVIGALFYWVGIKGGPRNTSYTKKGVKTSIEVYTTCYDELPTQYKDSLVKAMQILERIQSGLKQKFES